MALQNFARICFFNDRVFNLQITVAAVPEAGEACAKFVKCRMQRGIATI